MRNHNSSTSPLALGYSQARYTYTNAAPVPGCFSTRFNINARCSEHNYDTANGSQQRWGYCDNLDGSDVTNDTLAAFLGDPGRSHAQKAYVSVSYMLFETDWWYMDANCHWVNPGPNTQICGFAGVSYSPISLIWEKGTPLRKDMTVVPFSISADQPNGFTLWVASEKAPLLVYDPKHTGKVASAKQLFGNYAFGGKTTDVAEFNNESLREPWANGYEALALLDADKDGKITGAELEPLALWFDRNRDGVVDDGELLSAVQAGVTTIFYTPDGRDSKTGDISASIGYERIENGKTIQGSSVDWFSQTFASKEEAVQALTSMLKGEPEAKTTGDQALQNWPNRPLEFKPHTAEQHGTDVSGYWLWKMDDDKKGKHPGIFAFEQQDGKLIGFSVAEALLAENSQGLHSTAQAVPASGTVALNKERQLELAFEVTKADRQSVAKSVATLSEDGLHLRGKTTQSFVLNSGAETATVAYEWEARKFAK